MRRSQLRASKAMQDRTLAHPRITVHFNTEVDDVYGAEVLHGLKLRDANTGGDCGGEAQGSQGEKREEERGEERNVCEMRRVTQSEAF